MQCGPGNGRKTSGGGDKVPHNGWPAVTGILWKVLDSSGRKKVGGAANDELLGHHGSDRLFGGAGNDILWGDWDPANNNTHQKDVLDGGPGNDWLYPSHGSTVVKGGAGKDYVWAYYGRGTIDCGPGKDTARVKLNGPWKVRNCERVLHFCAFGSDGHGGCLKPGEKRKGIRVARRVGRGPRLALTYAREGGDQLAHDGLGARRPLDGQRQRVGVVAQLHAQERAAAALGGDEGRDALARPGRWAEAQDGVGRVRVGGDEVARDGGHLARVARASRPRSACRRSVVRWSWEYRAPSSRLEVKGRSAEWTKRRSPSARSPAAPG